MNAINLKKKLALARKLCLGMPEEVYQFAEHLAVQMNDPITPEGLVLQIALTWLDIDSQHSDEGRKSVLRSARYILQVIDVVADDEFADAVRAECKTVFGWDVIKRYEISYQKIIAKYGEPGCHCPQYVKAAVKWWAGAMQVGIISEVLPSGHVLKGMKKQLSKDTVERFFGFMVLRMSLMIEENRRSTLWIDMDYEPVDDLAQYLYEAAQLAGIKKDLVRYYFPTKISMSINRHEVSIRDNARGTYVIWKKR